MCVCVCVCGGGGGGGRGGRGAGGGNLGVIMVQVFRSSSQYFEIYPIWPLKKNGPIHILDRLKC